MSKRSASGVLLASVIWLIIVGALAVAYRYYLHPQIQRRIHRATGSESRYRHEIALSLDSFSGYAVLRSEDFRKALEAQGIKLRLVDDGADYMSRIRDLQADRSQLAVFTIDSFLATSAELGSCPGTIVLIIDETRGADAIVAYRQGVATLQDLDSPDARIVLTPHSPSEFLARVALAHFNLPRLPKKWMQPEDGAEAVLKAFRAAAPTAKRAFVLWEPFVSRALEERDAVVLLDSSKLRGYILDVLVAQRDFLRANPEVVEAILEAYLRTAYRFAASDGMVQLVIDDARQTGVKGIREKQARQLVNGIEWKNTLENYAHFGILAASDAKGLPHIEDIIAQIREVLVKTGGLTRDPLRDSPASAFFYDSALRAIQSAGFHPGRAVNILGDAAGGGESFETVRGIEELPALDEAEWARLTAVGEMQVPSVSFARGAARLHVGSERALGTLAAQLRSFPHYYLKVVGHARAQGDANANLALARERAQSVADYLISVGVNPNRIRAVADQPSTTNGDAQSVSFVVAQKPY